MWGTQEEVSTWQLDKWGESQLQMEVWGLFEATKQAQRGDLTPANTVDK